MHNHQGDNHKYGRKDPMLVEFLRAGQRGQCGSVWFDSVSGSDS